MKRISLGTLVLLLSAVTLHAQQPSSRVIPFNGVATTMGSTGQALTLQLWDDPTAGALVFSENQTLDVDANGAISFTFGAATDTTPSTFTAGQPGLGLADPNKVLVALPITNSGAAASNVEVRSIMLRSATPLKPSLPIAIGNVAVNQQFIVNASFDLADLSGLPPFLLTVHGTFLFKGEQHGWVVHRFIHMLPKPAPGSAPVNSTTVPLNRVSGAPFPPDTINFPVNEINPKGPPIPIGDLPGTPTPAGSGTLIGSAQIVSLRTPSPFKKPVVSMTNTASARRVGFRGLLPHLKVMPKGNLAFAAVNAFAPLSTGAGPRPGGGTTLASLRNGDTPFVSPDNPVNPVVFKTNSAFGATLGFPGAPADTSVAVKDRLVMATGNTWAALSTDGGVTFAVFNPTIIFPNRDANNNVIDGGLCCDQIVVYAASIDRFIWLTQYWRSATPADAMGNPAGPNRLRIAAARPADLNNNFSTAWTCCWDLTSATFNLGNNWMDYPDLSVGTNFLYVSVDAVGAGGGLLVARIPLTQIRDATALSIDYTTPSDSTSAYGSKLMQNTASAIYWAGHAVACNQNNATMRIFRLAEGSGQYSWSDVTIACWRAGAYTSITPDGTNWTSFASGPGSTILGATRTKGPPRTPDSLFTAELWFAWSAPGGGNFPEPHIQLVRLDSSNLDVIQQTQIWNPDFAFQCISLATNSNFEVGMSLAFGGGRKFEASHAVGIFGDLVVYPSGFSDHSQNRWGDYLTVRQFNPDGRLFGAIGYEIKLVDASKSTSCGTSPGCFVDPHYVLFGRQSDLAPPPGPPK